MNLEIDCDLWPGPLGSVCATYNQGGIVAAVAVVVVIIGWWVFDSEFGRTRDAITSSSETAFDRRIEDLKAHGFYQRYVRAVQGLLNWLAEIFGEDRRPEEQRASGDQWRALPAWTAPSYFFALGLAAIYTYAFVFLTWLVTGNGQLAGAEVFPPNVPLALRLFVFGTLVVVFVVARSGLRDLQTGRRGRGYIKILGVLLIAFAAITTGAGVVVFAYIVAANSAVAVAVAGAGAGVFLGVTILVVVGAFAFAFLGAVPYPVAGAVALAVALAVGLAVGLAAQRYHRNVVIPGLFSIFLVISFLSLFAFDGRAAAIEIDKNTAPIVIFLGLIPAVNAIADWLSLCVSRNLFNRLVAGNLGLVGSVLIVIVDVVLALFFLVLVTLLTVAAMALAERLHSLGGAPKVFDVGQVLEGIREAPLALNNWWVYLTLGTTLVPTIIHFGAAIVAVFASFSTNKSRMRSVELLENARLDSDKSDRAARSYAFFKTGPLVSALLVSIIIGALVFADPSIRDAFGASFVQAGSILFASAEWVMTNILAWGGA